MSESVAIRIKCLDKTAELALSLEQACSCDRKGPGSEEFTIERLVAEADFPPLHSGTDASLCNVVDWFDTIIVGNVKRQSQ